ncbi:nucleotide exchange factor GrpE [Synechococcus sp. PCC 6312]|uniref:nucleotide exchange factor GrpE n=1 Tax=Synechococcus sp. (strain ATCC 27167 / PCC 6312) TaxID=195253 RepID=UPI00029EF13D|nr:nucleotide exchange factor GrpE [Synechococcus sp. PCC 6312]AFY59776.1 molecular chaperone GrpE (heat shock protein) [Synechococcus sp. PCC 6312]
MAAEVTPAQPEPESPEMVNPHHLDISDNTPPVVNPDSESLTPEATADAVESRSSDNSDDPTPEVIVALQEAITRLSTEADSFRQQLEDRDIQYKRLAADFDNFRKRTQREKDELTEQIKCSTITELLPVVDSFERARAHIAPQTEAEETIHRSYQGVYKQLVDCLKRVGVAAMRPEGKPFDPNLHEAVMREVSSEYPEGTVLEQLVRGYILGERVLRHAMVKVSIPGESHPPVDPENAEASSN